MGALWRHLPPPRRPMPVLGMETNACRRSACAVQACLAESHYDEVSVTLRDAVTRSAQPADGVCSRSARKACAWAIDRLKRCCEKMGEGSLHCSFPASSSDEDQQAAADAGSAQPGADAQGEEAGASDAAQQRTQPDAEAVELDQDPAATTAAGRDPLEAQPPDDAAPHATAEQVDERPPPEPPSAGSQSV